MKNIIISNPEKLEEIKKRIKKDGAEKLHVIADFDRTITKFKDKDKKIGTTIAQIRQGGYLGKDYIKKAEELFDIYHPIEINPDIDEIEKSKKMDEWWEKHFDLLAEKGLSKNILKDILNKKMLILRKGSLELLDFLKEKQIPLIIISAGLGDMIKEILKENNRLYQNIHLITNLFEFDKNGSAIKALRPFIHIFNKKETTIKELPIYNKLKQRKNIILLGDNLEDIGMVKGFEYDNLIKVGFLNENPEQNLESYKKVYDIVILNDGDMDYVNALLNELMSKSQ